MSEDSLSSKKLLSELGIVSIFKNLIQEVNKKNPEGEFLIIRNKMLRLPLDSKKRFFIPTKFVLNESYSEHEYSIAIYSKINKKSSVLVGCSCSCYFLDCYNLSLKMYQGWSNTMIGIRLPYKDSCEEIKKTITNFILDF